MSERPILFSASMVRAILEGRKTQTRRLVKKPEYFPCLTGDCPHWDKKLCAAEMQLQSPYGQLGDRLWVRETHCPIFPQDPCYNGGRPIEIDYRATPTERMCDLMGLRKWIPAIHMRREYSRITLEVTGVRVERLQEISMGDAKAEGCEPRCPKCGYTYSDCVVHLDHRLCGEPLPASALIAYAELWDQINVKRAPWASDPWVWVLEFKRVLK